MGNKAKTVEPVMLVGRTSFWNSFKESIKYHFDVNSNDIMEFGNDPFPESHYRIVTRREVVLPERVSGGDALIKMGDQNIVTLSAFEWALFLNALSHKFPQKPFIGREEGAELRKGSQDLSFRDESIQYLADNMEENDITFSRYCSSGYLGDKCSCSRCMIGHGKVVTDISERLSKIESLLYKSLGGIEDVIRAELWRMEKAGDIPKFGIEGSRIPAKISKSIAKKIIEKINEKEKDETENETK